MSWAVRIRPSEVFWASGISMCRGFWFQPIAKCNLSSSKSVIPPKKDGETCEITQTKY